MSKKRSINVWNAEEPIRLAFKEGLAVVHRKHKKRQANFGPTRALIHELFVIIAGELEILADGKWWAAPPRSFAFFKRNTKYGIRQNAAYHGEAQIVNILFDVPSSWEAPLPRPPLRLSGPWWRRFMDLEATCGYDAAGQRVLPVKSVVDFVEKLGRAAASRPELSPASTVATLREGPRRPDTGADWLETWALAEDIIRQRAAGGLSVDELAEAAHVSPTQLRRVFLSARGISPKSALTQWRIEEARKLLAAGQFNVTEVSEQVGFTTVQRFTSVFKDLTGETPSAFARRS
jgi:AraC-like DNA-binding protein